MDFQISLRFWQTMLVKLQITTRYCQKNPNVSKTKAERGIEHLRQIRTNTIGIIKLDPDLVMETVNVIFERVNSSGVQLSQADFANVQDRRP